MIERLIIKETMKKYGTSVNEVAEKYGCTIVGCAKEMRVFTDASVNCSAFCGGAVTVYPDVQVNDGDVV